MIPNRFLISTILESCRFVSLATNATHGQKHYSVKLSKEGDSVTSFGAEDTSAMAVRGDVYEALGVDTTEILQLISESSHELEAARAKFTTRA